MKLTFLGAAQTVTGSCHLLEVGGIRIMIDCGMFQGPRAVRERNYHNFPVEPDSIDFLLLTHAHIDHSGLIPKLFKHGFRGRVLATPPTVDLCEVMLPDSGYIQEMEVERINRKALRAGRETIEPIYTIEDARQCVQKFERVNHNEIIKLTTQIEARFRIAGHMLGSAIIEIMVSENGKKEKFVFTGDLGEFGKPYIKDPDIINRADYLIMESTYGNRLHKDRGNRADKLKKVIEETYYKGGNLIIPAFAVERTQDLLYDLNALYIAGSIPNMDVYIDSPMAVAATEIFKKHPECFDRETRKLISDGLDPLEMPLLRFSRTVEESIELNKRQGGAIILSASGMCDAGRIKYHLKHNLWRPESTILFVGYQAPGTKGYRILNGASSVLIHGEEVMVRADIRNIDGYSSHADQKSLLQWLNGFTKKPSKVFLVHGAPDALEEMEKLVPLQTGCDAYAPQWKESIVIAPEMQISKAEIMEVYAAMSTKLQKFFYSVPDNKQRQSVMIQMRDLEKNLDQAIMEQPGD